MRTQGVYTTQQWLRNGNPSLVTGQLMDTAGGYIHRGLYKLIDVYYNV
jgi:hypothetical protein